MSVFIDSSGSISSGYYVFTKTNTSFTITNNTKIEYLLIGGGGGGGTSHGGGGGAGGIVHKTDILISAGTYSITVGSGGLVNIQGGNTSISGINDIAFGGGSGGGAVNGIALSSSTIGSGGGGSGYTTSKSGGKTTSEQGNNGGDSVKEPGGGGGGGGSGTAGFTNSGNNGGIGGDGTKLYSDLINIISPYMQPLWKLATTSGYIASGGGGGTWENNYSALGGKGGAGSGGSNNGALIQPTNAIPNTGSGGGGGGSGGQSGANGASGLIIIYIKSTNSSSGNYNIGTYNLKPINITQTGSNNYNNISLIGSLEVNPAIINTYIVQKVLKAYDGNIYLTNSDISITSNQFIPNDNIYFNSTGFFNDSSVIGQNKPVTITNLLIGYDSINYTLDSNLVTLTTSGTITKLSSVTFSTTGNWSNASNWTPNTAPISDYVPNVIIPINLIVTYDYDNLISNIPVCSIINNGTINFIGSSDYTFSNDISGTGFIIKDSSNVLTISSENNNISNTTINKGTLKIDAINAIGTGNIIINTGTILELNGYNINNNIALSGTITNNNNSGNIYLYNPIILNYDSIFNCLGTINIESQIQSNGYNISLQGTANYILDNSLNIISSLSANTSGSINLNSTINLTLLNITCNNLIIITSSNATITINGNITANSIYIQSNNIIINSGFNIVSNNKIILNSLNYFKNYSSSNAIVSTNSNWAIYSKDPTLNIFGGLSSGNKAIWGEIYNSLTIPITNTYIFSNNGTLIVTTTNNSKIYGASSINISNNYTLSGTTQNYPSIFIPNLISDCSTGTLSITSLGTPQSATVQSYQIIAGGLSAQLGFTVSYINSGYLTLYKVNLSIVALNDSKIYGENTTNYNLEYDNNGNVITTDNSGYTISGLITSIDSINSIQLNSLGAKSISSVASYTIIPNIYSCSPNVNSTNYNISFINGNLNVTRRNFTISATDSLNNIYKGFAYDFTNKITISGIVNDDLVQFSGNLSKTDAGTYASNLSVTSYNNNNYNDPIINNATFIINKADYISANGTEVYNGTNIFSNSNLLIRGVNGETFKVSSGVLYLDHSGNIQTNNRLLSLSNLIIIGTNSSFKSSNYNNLDVTKTSVTVTTSYLTTTGSRIYDGTTIINGNILSCLGVNGETFPIVGNGSTTNLLSANVTNNSSIIKSADCYFKFDSDYKNYGTDSTIINCSSFGTTSFTTLKSRNCVTFNNNAYIISPSINFLTQSTKFSFCFWIYMPSDNNVYETISIGNGNFNNNSSIFQGDVHDNYFDTYIAIPNYWTNLKGPSYTSKQWTHICYTILANGSSNSNITMYVNGQIYGPSYSPNNTLKYLSSYYFIFGRAGDGASRYLNGGAISEFLAYQNRILTQTEVLEIYNNSSQIVPINLNSFDGLAIGESLNGALQSNYFTLQQSINYSAITITPATFTVTGSKIYDSSNNILAQNCQISGISGEIYTLSGYGLLTSKNVTTSLVNISDISNLIINNGPSPSNYNNYYPLNTSNTFINVNKATLNISGSMMYNATYTISGSIFTAYGVNNETFSLTGSISVQNSNVQTTTLNNLGTLYLGDSFNSAMASNYNDISGNNVTITINPNNLSIQGTQIYNGRTSLIASNYLAYGINSEYFEINGNGNSNNLSNPNQGKYTLKSLDGLSLSTGYNGAIKTNYNFIYNNLISTEITISRANLTLTGSKVYDGSNNILANKCRLLGVNGETFNLSGYGLLQSKNKTTSSVNMSDISHLTINNGTNPSNYNPLTLSETSIMVNPYPVDLIIDYQVTKTYDGSNNYILNDDDILYLTTQLTIDDNIISVFGYFNDKNVENNKILSLSNANINDGNNGANYIISYLDSDNNEIFPKLLTIQVNDSFKYFINNDPIGYNDVTYTGFVDSENISDISGSLLISRSDSSNNKPGIYTGVLVPSGYGNQNSINKNYKINYSNGTFTIFGASNLQIYIGDSFNNTITTYGTFPTYNLKAQYIDSSGNIYNIPSENIMNETIDENGINVEFVTILDGIGGTITFYLNPNNIIISSSKNYSYGSYTLIATNILFSNSTFQNINVIGNLIINKYNLNISNLAITNITKVYDGNNNITTSMITSWPNVIPNDIVNVNVLNGTFDNNNVGINKIINIVVFLDGPDSNNYNLTLNTLNSDIGSITQLSNVTLSTSGNWSVASNWTGNAIPLLNNVINIIIPSSLQVTYDYDNLISNSPTSTISNNGIITFTGSNPYTFSNNISGNGSIIIDTSNVIIISGNNDYSSVTINQGILKISSLNAILNTTSINLYSSLDLNGYSLSNLITFYSGSLINSNLTPSILSGNITINSNVKISGNITMNGIISSSSSTYGIVFGNGGNYNLDNSANYISNIATSGTINSLFLRTTSNLNISNLTINNNTYNSILSNGLITLISTQNISINSNNTINSTKTIILSATGNFINNSSSNAVSSSNSKWLIYSTDPSFNTFGGLNSTNIAIWGQTYNTYYPSTLNNNYYIFSAIGVININTSNVTKIYGSIYNFSLDISSYTLSGNTQSASNYTNVFINSTLDDSSTGTLVIDSSGSLSSAIIGDYIINSSGLSGKNGYIINNNNIGILTVNKATLNITARNQNTNYGLGLILGNNLYDSSGLVNNDKITSLILYQNGSNIIPATQYAGTYRGSINGIIPSNAQGSGLTNYNINYLSGILTINQSSLIITAKDQSTTYGSTLQLGTILYDSSGLVNNEKISSVTLKQNNSTNTSNNLSVGLYSGINGIIPSNPIGIIISNYNINYINGTLNITKATLTYLANSITIERDLLNNNISVSGTVTGFLNSDSITNNTSGTLIFTTSATTSSSIGSYAIIGSGLTSSNYNIINTSSNNSALKIVDPGTPIISLISPNIGDINGNTLVTITGSNFQKGCTVTFGTVPSTNVNYIGTGSITVKSPKNTSVGIVNIIVSNSTSSSTPSISNNFTYASVPDVPTNLIAIADNKGASLSWQAPSNNGNSQITQYKIITNPNTNIIYSTTSPIRISNLINNSNYTFQVSAKNNIGYGSFSNESSPFTPYPPPQIVSITPNYSSFSGGEQITIIGTNFYNVTKIQFGNSNIISYNVNSTTNITFTIPSASNSGSINISITATGGTVTNTNGFTYYDVPSINSISPLLGTSVGGTQITITGSNFTNGTLVTIGSYKTNIISITESTIIVTTTSYEITENIILSLPLNVTTLGGTSFYNYYTYILPQKLSSTLLVTPNLLYIFGTNISGSSVTINGQNADYVSNKSTSEINVTYYNSFLNGNSINISNAGMNIEFNIDTSNIQQNYYGSSLSKILTE